MAPLPAGLLVLDQAVAIEHPMNGVDARERVNRGVVSELAAQLLGAPTPALVGLEDPIDYISGCGVRAGAGPGGPIL
jgi:hypothetical protein